MNRKDGLLWKDILEHVFDDFLRFMHPGAAELLDLEKGFVFLDKELDQVFPHPEGAVGLQIADKLVRVYTREGGEEWILVHVEVQEQYRQDFSRRMFRYFTGFWISMESALPHMPFLPVREAGKNRMPMN